MTGVPVLYVTGPVGVGKSSVIREAGRLLRDRDVSYGLVDLEWIGDSWPRPPDDPWNGRVVFHNLRAMWDTFARSGAERLLCAGVLEDRSHLSWFADAVPGARVTVVRLRAPLAVIEERLRRREPDTAVDWYLDMARALAGTLEVANVEDHVLDNVDGSLTEVAARALHLAGWI